MWTVTQSWLAILPVFCARMRRGRCSTADTESGKDANIVKNILVFPCGSEIGLEIHRTVRYSTYFHLIGASSVPDHGQYVFSDYIGDIPMMGDENFIPMLHKIVLERRIDAIYPAMDAVLTVLKQHEPELGCKVITSPVETTQICLSKRKTYAALTGAVRIPEIYQIHETKIFPVFLKPSIGYGARGTKIVETQSELESFLSNKTEDYLILEYLPGEEYTIDCFTDRHGRLRFAAGRQRNRIRNGISVNTTFVEDQTKFQQIAEAINQQLSFRGAWFAQVKKDKNGELCLLEVAARFGGSSGLAHAIGVNFAQLSLFDAFDYEVNLVKNSFSVSMDRALDCRYHCDIQYDTVYVDYDDCILLEKSRLNVKLVSFLVQCINRKKRIILLSKHDGDLEESLSTYRIRNLFDEIVHIGREENKYDYIKEDNAIFIDDSYAERKAIKEQCQIAVFSPDMIDVLLEGEE